LGQLYTKGKADDEGSGGQIVCKGSELLKSTPPDRRQKMC
jgi:hypothetical protein